MGSDDSQGYWLERARKERRLAQQAQNRSEVIAHRSLEARYLDIAHRAARGPLGSTDRNDNFAGPS